MTANNVYTVQSVTVEEHHSLVIASRNLKKKITKFQLRQRKILYSMVLQVYDTVLYTIS